MALFLLPALALTVQSGYSFGAVLLLVGALCTVHRWPRDDHDPWTWALAVVFVGMGVLWYVLADPREDWGQWDRPAKFFLSAACLLFVSRAAPRPQAQFWGLIVGCLGAGAVTAA